jgi:hypothetical protein
MKVLVCRQNEFSLVSVVMSSAVVGFVATALIRRWYSQSSEVDDEDDFEDGDDESFADKKKLNSDFPPHPRRAVYKKKRRKESVRFLAMKKPMYDNIKMYDPDGDLLCTISQKKANWYVRKQLGEWNRSRNAIHLSFKPKGKSENVYNQSQKQNVCVSCGDDKHHMRHYVVPYCYRTLFPEKYKTHMPHDIGKFQLCYYP